MGDTLFRNYAMEQFMEWINTDRKTVKRIHELLNDISRNGADKGIGKPEKLKHTAGWSRRIDKENRLVYSVKDNVVIVDSCKGHYDD